MTHATMLNLGTFLLAIPGAIASAADQIQKVKKKLAKKKGRLPKPTFSDSHPMWSGLLTLSMLVALGFGFWMVLHPFAASTKTAATVPALKPVPPSSATPAPSPTTPPPRSRKSPGDPIVRSHPAVSAPPSNAAPTTPPITITGGITQGGAGDCQQNIIGGYGNTQNCVVPPFTVSKDQAATIAAYLKATNLRCQREVMVDFEYAAPGGEDAAKNLAAAFNEAGVEATVGPGAMILVTPCNPRFIAPGLSVDCVTPSDQTFLEALGDALAAANLASAQNPIQGHRAPLGSTLPLIFVIRKR